MTIDYSTQTERQLCPLCSAPLEEPDRCSKCDWVRPESDSGSAARATRDVAALAISIVPGAGHIFKGYTLLGWLLMLVGVPVIVVLAFAFTMFLGWLMIPAYWIGVAADAYLRRDLRPPATTPVR
jgi:hypothetical protein